MAKKLGGKKIIAFQIPASLDGFTLLKDGGLSMRFTTNEITAENMMMIKQFHNSFGYLMFKENKFSPEELPAEDADVEGKSQSKRLRNVLFVLWETSRKAGGAVPEDFEQYYRTKTEEIITYLKGKLPPK